MLPPDTILTLQIRADEAELLCLVLDAFNESDEARKARIEELSNYFHAKLLVTEKELFPMPESKQPRRFDLERDEEGL
jgi:Zn-dependent peptidase ImmA (M78 family)